MSLKVNSGTDGWGMKEGVGVGVGISGVGVSVGFGLSEAVGFGIGVPVEDDTVIKEELLNNTSY